MKRIYWLGVLLVAALGWSACGSPAAAPESFTQTAGDLTANLVVAPYPPPLMQETTLELTLLDAGGLPVVGADVRLDLTMPGMAMPPNHPTLADMGGGIYRGPALFTMAGDWQIAVAVAYPGGSEQFAFRLHTR
ncbi:MAG: FixH family protein [Chloroflexi bacterium]|nr:FixH family protein [Chloroflexota bacterium]MBU1750449.1 FixH family protein [Chloroflexota bacterium]